MAALSFYSNYWPDSSFNHHQPQQHFPSDTADFFHPTPPQLHHDPAFLTTFDYISSTDSTFFPNACVDDEQPFFDDASSFLYTPNDFYHPYFSAPISTGFFPSEELHYSKRQKVVCASQLYLEPNNFFCDGDYFPQALNPPELFSVPWDDQGSGIVFNNQAPAPSNEEVGSGGCLKKLSPNNLSAQTIAARERRRKITAKTQELGELIPGGNKMNTAEMFHSAFKYVKFLQAQVEILQLMQESEEETAGKFGELQILESPTIQEKLYSEEKCLVPKEFVQNIASFPEIQAHPSIFNSINQMLQTSSSST